MPAEPFTVTRADQLCAGGRESIPAGARAVESELGTLCMMHSAQHAADDIRRARIRAVLAKRYRGAIEVTDAMVDAVTDGLALRESDFDG